MPSRTCKRSTRFFFLLAVISVFSSTTAPSLSPALELPFVLAQSTGDAATGAAPVTAAQPENPAASAHSDHGAPATQPAEPELMPGINKKRVAFWGVVTMTVTSLVFTVFGAWAIWKTPKPGQQRPDSAEK